MESFGKYLCIFLVAINALIMTFGISLICVGCYMLTNEEVYARFMYKGIFSIPGLAIFLGTVITIIFFLGCYGIMCKSLRLTGVFGLVMYMLLFMSIVCGIASFIFGQFVIEGDAEGQMETAMEQSLQRYNSTYDGSAPDRQFFDIIQPYAECCGVHGSSDYLKLNLSIPQSCCNPAGSHCTTTDSLNVFTDGCYTVFSWLSVWIFDAILYSSIGLALFELFIIMGTGQIVRQGRKDYKTL